MVVSDSGNDTDINESQSLKALYPMLVTPSGSVICLIRADSKAYFSIVVNDDGRSMVSRMGQA